jgi:hypothetical protein
MDGKGIVVQFPVRAWVFVFSKTSRPATDPTKRHSTAVTTGNFTEGVAVEEWLWPLQSRVAVENALRGA